ncbi:MAG TPA: hypothetical protein VK559_11700 [Ferruginibacter sp.]|nr:hypothetical protein [Ferruginibacter sp.]
MACNVVLGNHFQSLKFTLRILLIIGIAYDSVLTTKDSLKQVQFIQTLYIDKATDGLKKFIQLKDLYTEKYRSDILKYPAFWNSIRPKTLQINLQALAIEKVITRFKKLYPEYKQPSIYFSIGCLNSGGTTTSDEILIGTEIAAADSTVNVSELSSWHKSVFKANQNVVYLVTHEMVHTQQKTKDDKNLLGICLKEGSADFVAELLLQQPLVSPYIIYGNTNERSLWEKFQKETNGTNYKDWVYNGTSVEHADLGYFMGYAICKTYYINTSDKKQAIKDIITLNYADSSATTNFLTMSNYPNKWQ